VNASGTLTTSRTYATVQDVETELVGARIWIGFHSKLRDQGEALGTAASTWALARNFLPADEQEGYDSGE
jgi:hypothetical protein